MWPRGHLLQGLPGLYTGSFGSFPLQKDLNKIVQSMLLTSHGCSSLVISI
jgi:hypothetical protein